MVRRTSRQASRGRSSGTSPDSSTSVPRAPVQRGLGLKQRVAGAELRLLQCKPQARPFRRALAARLRLVADDHDRGYGRRSRPPEHVLNQREAGDPVEHLRQRRLHPRALAGREDDDVDVGHDSAV